MTTTLVTGSNRGIGLELCRALAAEGHRVIAACRSGSPELDALGVEVVTGVDVADDASVAALGKKLAGRRIDWLIANAGILEPGGLDALDFDSMRRQFEVNSLGPLRVVKALLPSLGEGSKIGIVSSRVGSLADNGSGGMYGYRMSKAALNALTCLTAKELAGTPIKVNAVCPGWCRTAMGGEEATRSADEGARGIVWAALLPDDGPSGGFFRDGQPIDW